MREVKRTEEMERQLRYFHSQINAYNELAPKEGKEKLDLAPAPADVRHLQLDDLAVRTIIHSKLAKTFRNFFLPSECSFVLRSRPFLGWPRSLAAQSRSLPTSTPMSYPALWTAKAINVPFLTDHVFVFLLPFVACWCPPFLCTLVPNLPA